MSTLCNVLLNNVIRTWLIMTVEDHRVVLNGVGENIGRFLGVFYSYDGMVGSRDSD